MLTPDGEAKVADFGLARITLGDDPRLTKGGNNVRHVDVHEPRTVGRWPVVDIRSDLYSLGVTLFHMLYGQPLFGRNLLALAMQHVKHTEVPEPSKLANQCLVA
ncbi:MAG: hypothetical protein U0930_17010 [Pirellulales bacterium]